MLLTEKETIVNNYYRMCVADKFIKMKNENFG